MLGGVSKSGSPWLRLMISRPAAFSSVASAVIAIVGDGFTRARRLASKDMIGCGLENGAPNLMPASPPVKTASPSRSRSPGGALLAEIHVLHRLFEFEAAQEGDRRLQ